MKNRPLKNAEIAALEKQGCFSSDWSKISVRKNFNTAFVHQVAFKGEVSIGELGGEIKNPDGTVKESGLFNSRIENCELGNQVLIRDVHLIKNYRVKNEVILDNVDLISVEGSTSFGNGTEIEVLNEGGGRELLMFDKLNAQLAYLLVSYRHDPDLIDTINRMIRSYAEERTSNKGYIGRGTRVLNSGSLYDLHVGEYAMIRGSSLLKNATISSNQHAPAFMGEDVIAKNFMLMSGSSVDGGALLENCFVGQGVKIGKQFSAENSVFFANCEGFHSEAVSVFAGPYTVTHHRSTLLIAGMFSFYNAGSGTNQSNHMYKLGPVHQGIMERGSKTGSFAYLLWPSRIGAFTVVMGKNMSSFDASDFPFSYVTVDKERSILTPGMNLFTVGTRRDCEKWPGRDRRKDPEKSDLINFEFLNPYIIQKVIRSLRILRELYEKTSKEQEFVIYKGIRIKRLMLKSTQRYYQLALNIFVGHQLSRKLEAIPDTGSIEALRKDLADNHGQVSERWIDMAGMIAPQKAIQDLISQIKSGQVPGLDEILEGFRLVHEAYDNHAWNWTTAVLSELYDIDLANAGPEQLIRLIDQWESDAIRLDKMILNDASKEFDPQSRIGFGIDGDEEVMLQDFEAVRGKAEQHKFVTGLQQEIQEISRKAAQLKKRLGKY